jgi:alpha-glucosidase
MSAVTGLIGGGLSGYSLNHSDIGGYTGFSIGGMGLRRSHELLARWQEFSAFTPAFRTHEGLLPGANAQIYDSDESLAIFDRNARIFASLHFYRKRLFAEAEAHGYPVVRAMFLEFPDDPHAYEVDDQFMLGSEILVAPVLNPQQNGRSVYLPAGKWVHVWSSKQFGDPGHPVMVVVPAPIGEPPVFLKSGSDIEREWIIPATKRAPKN